MLVPMYARRLSVTASQSARPEAMRGLASRARGVLVLLALGVGCGGKSHDSPPPEPPSAPEASKSPVAAKPAEACSGDDDCVAKASAHQDAGRTTEAQAMYQAGCDQGGVSSCELLASIVPAGEAKRGASARACELGSTRACFNLAEDIRAEDPAAAIVLYTKACAGKGVGGGELSTSCGRGAMEAYKAEDFKSAKTMAGTICNKTSSAGCGLLGVIHTKGQGVPQDVKRGRGYLKRGCEGKDEEACRNLKALDAAVEDARVADVLPVEGANVSIGSIGVDGLQATDLKCRREGGGGLFGGAMGAISGISKRKKRLTACGSKPEDVRVRWTTSGGRIKTVDVEASSKKVSACVKKALKGADAAFGGTCAATFSVGK